LACKKLTGGDSKASPSAESSAAASAAPVATAAEPTVMTVPTSDPKLDEKKDYWVEGKGGKHRMPKKITISGVTFRHMGGCSVKKLSGIGGAEVGCLENVPLCVYTQRFLLKEDGWDIVKEKGKSLESYQVVAEKGSKQIAVDVEPMLKGKPDMACKMMIFAGNKK